MKLDLVRFKAVEITFSTVVRLESEFFGSILDTQPDFPKKSGFATFGTRYSRREITHLVSGFMGLLEDQGYYVGIKYDREATVRPPRGVPPISQMFEVLSSVGGTHNFSCKARFRYPATEYQSIVGIPVRLEESKALPYNEIRGLRVVRREGEEILYDVSLDRRNEDIYVETEFNYVGMFSTELPSSILSSASEISSAFVFLA